LVTQYYAALKHKSRNELILKRPNKSPISNELLPEFNKKR